MNSILWLAVLALGAITPAHAGTIPAPYASWGAQAVDWHGTVKYAFTFEERNAFVIVPQDPLPSRPWVWRARFPGYHDEVDRAVVNLGFHVAFVDTGNLFGSPRAMAVWDRFYDRLTGAGGLSPTVSLYGVSRGGLFVYNWAARHPERVNCIYADTPVLDFRSWPGGTGKGQGSPADWTRLLAEYGLTEQEALDGHAIPLENLAPLAAAGIPLLHVIGENDQIVPPAENTYILEERYRELGGVIEVRPNRLGEETLQGHHFPLDDPEAIARFILNHSPLPPLPDGETFITLRDGLRNFRRVALQRGHARVAYLGGSITYNPGWQTLVSADLQRRFPACTFDVVRAGIPSVDSTPHAFRLTTDVWQRGPVDLLFVEAAVNDHHNGRTPTEMLRGMEGVVRHARTLNPAIDIVLLHFAEPDKTADYQAGRIPPPIVEHEKVAGHYRLPSLDLAHEVQARLAAGQFDWQRDFRNLHPSPFGQRLYYASIRRLLNQALATAPAEGDVEPCALPTDPLDPASYFNGTYAPLHCAVDRKGFAIDRDWEPAAGGGTREGFVQVPMLVGTTPGDMFAVEFEGRGIGIFSVAGPDAGAIRYRLDGGAWRTLDLFTRWSRGLNLPFGRMLGAGLPPGPHRLEVEILDTAHPDSQGHTVVIRNFFVAG